MDMEAIADLLMPQASRILEAMMAGQPDPDWGTDEINARFAQLPKTDENLR